MKLNQIIAIEKGVKSRVTSELTRIYHTFQKPQLFAGLERSYQKRREEDEDLPPERTRVQADVRRLLSEIRDNMIELLDVTAQKDFANTQAKADVVVDGETVVVGAPVPYLIFLEKQLSNLKAELEKVPVCDTSQSWQWDDALGMFRSEASQTSRSKKMPKVITKAEATEHHPAQTELIYVDEVAGTWTQTRFVAALSQEERRKTLDRVIKLQKAVKVAREEANMAEADKVDTGAAIFDYAFRDLRL